MQGSATSGNTVFFSNPRDFVVNNPTFYNVQGGRDFIALGMKALSEHVIDGAEYDSSARDPPPLCHPGTRVQLVGKISTWFHDKGRQKALLWLKGPAGVGKSAVMQTFAESIAALKYLGAALFFSRLNDRKDPQRVFITVAFQLATRISSYRAHITEQVVLNPSLLNKSMKEQFRIFIVEPFGHQGIGSGEGPWGVLLDGLDECGGVDEQCKIVQLVSEFVLNFPHSSLVWVVASRAEPHIVATFANKAVAPSHWSEHIPINSTEACQDVERYLNTSFEAMRERYSYVPSSWPSETQFLKLTNGALGLFVFARTAVRFMEDPDHADPLSRLNLILSVIDHLVVKITDDHPFAALDVLYTQILTSIPPTLRCTTKRILGFILCTQFNLTSVGLSYPLESRNIMGLSAILHLEQSVVYSSLHKLHSVLEIPYPKDAHKSRVSFLHASFGDYLMDQTRSKEFFIDRGESVDEITRCLFKLYLDKPWDNDWAAYTPQLSITAGEVFYRNLKLDAENSLYYAVTGKLRSRRMRGPFVSPQDRSECLDILSQVNTAEPYWLGRFDQFFAHFLFKVWDTFPGELESRGVCKQLPLRDLRVDHLGRGRNELTSYCSKERVKSSTSSPHAPQVFVAALQSRQQKYPEQLVLICGSTPEKRNAFLLDSVKWKYYCIPYPY